MNYVSTEQPVSARPVCSCNPPVWDKDDHDIDCAMFGQGDDGWADREPGEEGIW